MATDRFKSPQQLPAPSSLDIIYIYIYISRYNTHAHYWCVIFATTVPIRYVPTVRAPLFRFNPCHHTCEASGAFIFRSPPHISYGPPFFFSFRSDDLPVPPSHPSFPYLPITNVPFVSPFSSLHWNHTGCCCFFIVSLENTHYIYNVCFPLPMYTLQASISKQMVITNSKRHAMDESHAHIFIYNM